MKSNFERHQFYIRYIITAVILLVAGTTFCYYLGLSKKQNVYMVLFLLLALGIVFVVCNICLEQVHKSVEDVSNIMIDVVEEKDSIKQEVYMQGNIGILYSNFYKMVQSLNESRSKEQREKEFLKEVISDISHQLKTPLASLKVFVDLLLEDKITDEEKKKNILNESANQLNRMEWMVLSMLKLARIEAGAIRFDMHEVNIGTMIAQVEESVHYLLADRKQVFHINCDEETSLVCDGDWLIEAIINLVKNASDYSAEDKNIWFEVEQNDLFTRLYIRDEGVGIAENDLAHIFKRFYRVHQEVNPNSVGIGLSLSKSIVEGMGGRLTVRSEEGVGTTFMITFVKTTYAQ